MKTIFFIVIFSIIISNFNVFSTDEITLYNKMIPILRSKLKKDPDYIKKMFNNAIVELLQKPDEIKIKMLYKDTEELLLGNFEKVEIKVKNGYAEQLCISNSLFDFNNIKIKMTDLYYEKRINMLSSENIELETVILEDDLDKFLKSKSKKIKVRDPSIKLEKGKVRLYGRFRTKFFGVSLTIKLLAYGYFKISDKTKIDFIPRSIKVNNMGVPRYIRNRVIRKINPILDFNDYSFNISLKTIKIEDDKIIFSSKEI